MQPDHDLKLPDAKTFPHLEGWGTSLDEICGTAAFSVRNMFRIIPLNNNNNQLYSLHVFV
jgi:hypothetical protein